MSKFEKRLCIIALVFVAIYLGAAVLTVRSRISDEEKIEQIQSIGITPAERQLLIAELFLPVLIVFTLTVCFIIVRKQRAKKLLELEEDTDETIE
jgi:hypothetical protein